ncbi:MAG: DUF4150 domain-containing protein [Deltaproteobacteria bacterium]|nr:DUF4150 domain-containing protein [Deltaproteobacteria bacterium]
MFAMCMEGGQCLAVPDACNTPTPVGPVPIPYPNMSMGSSANPGLCAKAVLVDAMPALHLGSQIPMSNGDEGGVAGGLVSGMFIGPTTFTMGSTAVFIEGQPAVHLSSPTGQNGSAPNAMGANLSPSQTKVLLLK